MVGEATIFLSGLSCNLLAGVLDSPFTVNRGPFPPSDATLGESGYETRDPKF